MDEKEWIKFCKEAMPHLEKVQEIMSRYGIDHLPVLLFLDHISADFDGFDCVGIESKDFSIYKNEHWTRTYKLPRTIKPKWLNGN